MTRIAEYGDIKDAVWSRVTVHKKAWSAKVRADVRLESVTAGWEPAGSCARWTDGYHAVRWYSDGAGQGRQYRLDDAASARAHFERLTREG